MIDVIIPAYNCTKTLDRTLNSLVTQKDKEFKVYIIDDCSTENIKSIVDNYINLIDIIYFRNTENVGCGMSRQVGINISNSLYFTFLDSDDIFLENTVEVFNNFIKNNVEYDILMTDFYTKNIQGDLRIISKAYNWCHGKLYSRNFFNKYNICCDPRFTMWCDDNYLNVKCFELAKVKTITIPTYIWVEENPNSITKVWVRDHPERTELFLEAMYDAFTFVLQYKDKLKMVKTITYGCYGCIQTEKEKELHNKLLEMVKKYGV